MSKAGESFYNLLKLIAAEKSDGTKEYTIWDLNQVFSQNRDLIKEIPKEDINESIEKGKQYLINEKNLEGLWGWPAWFEPEELKHEKSLSKIWTTAINLRALVRNGYPKDAPDINYGIQWLLNNKTPSEGWATLPQHYVQKYPDLCLRPNPYETSCALLTLLEVREKVPNESILDVVRLIESYQRDAGDWPIRFTPEEKQCGYTDVGATAITLGALVRTKMGNPDVINRGIAWLKENQNSDGGWGQKANTASETTKTCDALRALLEAGVNSKERCIRESATWLDNHQVARVGGENREGWVCTKLELNGQLEYGIMQNTAFAITALLRAGFTQRLPSIQAALRWIISVGNQSSNAWREKPPV